MAKKQESEIDKLELFTDSIRNKFYSIPAKKVVYKNITFAQLKVILILSYKKTASMSDIAKELNVTLPTTTGLVDKLVRNGYLKRRYEVHDRRLVYVELSTKGYKLREKFSKEERERFIEMKKSMTKTEWAKFMEALETIDTLLDKCKWREL